MRVQSRYSRSDFQTAQKRVYAAVGDGFALPGEKKIFVGGRIGGATLMYICNHHAAELQPGGNNAFLASLAENFYISFFKIYVLAFQAHGFGEPESAV